MSTGNQTVSEPISRRVVGLLLPSPPAAKDWVDLKKETICVSSTRLKISKNDRKSQRGLLEKRLSIRTKEGRLLMPGRHDIHWNR